MKRINILPKEVELEYRYKNRWIYLVRKYFFIFVLAILILEISLFGIIQVLRDIRINRLKAKFKDVKNEIGILLVKVNNKKDEVSRIKEKIEGVDKKIDQLEERLDFLSQIRKKPKDHSHILSEINSESPRKIWITHLSLKADKLKIIGGSYNTLLVTHFMSNLQQSPIFADADFAYTKKSEIEKVEIVEFEITCSVVRRKK